MVDKALHGATPGVLTAPGAASRVAGLMAPVRLLQFVILPVTVLLLWEAVGQFELLPAGIMPPPSRAVQGWYVWAFGDPGLSLNPYSGTWLNAVLFSAQRVGQGYALAILVGVPLGVLIGWSRLVARIVDPTIQSLRPI